MNNIEEYLRRTLEMRSAMRNGEYTWDDIFNLRTQYNMKYICKDNLRKAFAIIDELEDSGFFFIKKQEDNLLSESEARYKETSEINSNGTLSSDKLISLEDCDKENPESLLKAHGFSPKKFELVSAKNSIWQQGRKEGKLNLYSSKIVIKPLNEIKVSFEDIDRFFESRDYGKHVLISPVVYNDTKDFLEIDIADLHFGLLACSDETSDKNFDINIAEKDFKNAIGDIIQRCGDRKFKKIVIAFLGDILHSNNAMGTTAKGTPQDMDTRLNKIFDRALEMLISTIETFERIAPVEVVYVPGNHDRETGYMLNKALQQAFRKDSNVEFFNSPNPRKARKYGKCLIGWTHGDMKKDRMLEWMKTEYREEYGSTIYQEVHAGHQHSIETIEKEDSGMIVRYLSNLCPASSWEHSMGFNKGKKAITGFVWNEDKGLRDIWYGTNN